MSSLNSDTAASLTVPQEQPPVRVIARLDIKGVNVIKGVHLEGLRKVGQPNDLSMRYYHQGADEILFMDAVASLYERNSILPIVSEAARNVFIPMTVGGGIRSLDDIRDVLRSGADKVAINTAATKDPSFLSRSAEIFGSQCIVLSVEAKRTGVNSWQAMTDCGRETTGRNVIDWVREAEEQGVGEILITSIDHEGTRKGFDLNLVRAVSDAVSIPVVASGGGGSADHGVSVFADGKADAAAFASIFHFDTCPIGQLKAALSAARITVRPT